MSAPVVDATNGMKAKRQRPQPTRRTLELFLLLLALGVTALADFLVSSSVGASSNDTSWITHVVVLGLLLSGLWLLSGAHLFWPAIPLAFMVVGLVRHARYGRFDHRHDRVAPWNAPTHR